MLYGDKSNAGAWLFGGFRGCAGSVLRCATAMAVAALLLAGCGGGDGAAGLTIPASAGEANPASVPADTIESSALSANICSAPRTGIDPATGKSYPDRQGTYADEKKWVRAWIDETYLWYDEIPSTIRTATYGTPQALFEALRTTALTPAGKPRDRFHFMFDTAAWQALIQSGIEVGYGFELELVKSQPPRDVRVAYTEPGTPAAIAGITRGARMVLVDGLDVVSSPSVAALNSALFPTAAGQSHSFRLQELDGSLRTVALKSERITKVPVQNVKTLETATGKVGYLLFNDHIAPSESQLIAAVTKFKAEGVQDLVLDLRYNGGGVLDIASQLAYMIAGPSATTGAVFERLQFNRKNPFKVTEEQATTAFQSTTLGLSTPEGRPLPQLGLSRVTVLTGPGTCSASESIINGLRGVNVAVNVIGDTTCGKPYGFIPKDNCGTTYFAIQFKGVNNKGEGDYADGIAPTCAVADDFSKPLGDPAEGRLAVALSYRTTGICPAVTTAAAKASVIGSGEALLSGKSPARTGRILRTDTVSPR